MTPSKSLLNNQGSALLLVMVLLLGITIFGMTFGNNILTMQKQVSISNHKASREFNILQTLDLLKMENGLTESTALTDNANLANCIFGYPTSTCSDNCCQHGIEQGFYFVDPSDTTLAINNKIRLIGPPAAPTWYNSNSTICLPQNSLNECAYSLAGTFTASCPGQSSTCHHAEHLILDVKVTFNPNAREKNLNMSNKEYKIIYFNNINYPPYIQPIPDLSLSLSNNFETDLVVIGNSGHPSEIQNFIFTKLVSSDSTVATIVSPSSTPFSSGAATIKIRGLATGTAKITLQINDGGLENNISKELSFNVIVSP